MIRAVAMTRLSKLGVRLFAASHMSGNLHSLKGLYWGLHGEVLWILGV